MSYLTSYVKTGIEVVPDKIVVKTFGLSDYKYIEERTISNRLAMVGGLRLASAVYSYVMYGELINKKLSIITYQGVGCHSDSVVISVAIPPVTFENGLRDIMYSGAYFLECTVPELARRRWLYWLDLTSGLWA